MDQDLQYLGPAEVLSRFFDAMEKWETMARLVYKDIEAGRLDADVGASNVTSAITAIFAEFCAKPPSPDRFGPGRMRFGAHGPIYGRKGEEIVETSINGSKATIRTIQKGPPTMTLLYTLTHTKAGWRLKDNRQRVRPDGTAMAWDL